MAAHVGSVTVKVIPEIDPAELDAGMVEAIAVRVAEILARPRGFRQTVTMGANPHACPVCDPSDESRITEWCSAQSPALRLAKSVVIDGDEGTVTIDGESFGYFIAEGGPLIEHDTRAGEPIVVNLRILTEIAEYNGPVLP